MGITNILLLNRNICPVRSHHETSALIDMAKNKKIHASNNLLTDLQKKRNLVIL